MTDSDKTAQLLQLMTLLEQIDLNARMTLVVQTISFEDLTPLIWEKLQSCMPDLRELLGVLHQSVSLGSKVIDNDALKSHLTTVILSD